MHTKHFCTIHCKKDYIFNTWCTFFVIYGDKVLNMHYTFFKYMMHILFAKIFLNTMNINEKYMANIFLKCSCILYKYSCNS